MNGLKQFENSLTRQAEISLDFWTKELANMNDDLMNDPMAVVKELNDKTKLCTPGFLIRRQVQTVFYKELMDAVAETGEEYTDLFTSDNQSWPDSILKYLGQKLEKYALKSQKQIVKAKEWVKWMSDAGIPTKRELAIKLSFLLDMDDNCTTKFLLSCGHEPFSVRNPLDCICLFCKLVYQKNDWSRVESLLDRYENARATITSDTDASSQQIGTEGMTQEIGNTIHKMAESGLPEYKREVLEEDLLNYMYSIDTELTRRKMLVKKKEDGSVKSKKQSVYASGYSLMRRKQVLNLTKYLVKLYPDYDDSAYHGGDRKNTNSDNARTLFKEQVAVRIDSEGYPNLTDLSRAFICAHGWDFVKVSEVNLPSYGAQKKLHDNIPFNKEIYLFCKAYERSNRLGAIERFTKYPDHAASVERKDILLLAYLFISGYSRIEDDDIKDILYEMSEKDPDISEEFQNILSQLEDTCDMWDENEKIKGYISCINAFLLMFSFDPLYPPFILDRFFLYALVGEEIGTPGISEDGLAENLSDQWLETGYTEYEE